MVKNNAKSLTRGNNATTTAQSNLPVTNTCMSHISSCIQVFLLCYLPGMKRTIFFNLTIYFYLIYDTGSISH